MTLRRSSVRHTVCGRVLSSRRWSLIAHPPACEAATDGGDATDGATRPAPAIRSDDSGDDDDEEDANEPPKVLTCAALRQRVSDFTPVEPVPLDAFFGLVAEARWPGEVLDQPVLGVSDCRRFCFTEVRTHSNTHSPARCCCCCWWWWW